jgi:ABC-2 type transport system permease protein
MPHTEETTPGSVPDEYVLTNPALNYAEFLLRAVLPTVLLVVIAITAAYAVGSEFRRRGILAWWEISGQSIANALVGKLVPYWLVLFTMFAVMVGILDVALGVTFRGSVLLMAVSATLLIVAYQMVGCLMRRLIRNLVLGLSLTAIIVSPAFGYASAGTPRSTRRPPTGTVCMRVSAGRKWKPCGARYSIRRLSRCSRASSLTGSPLWPRVGCVIAGIG